ncbi:MAG: GNAT family N-acetyltransferase [Anaerolineae bacterium]
MNIELVRASSRDDTTLRNLYQFYIYEFTRFMTNWHVNYAGRYTEDDLDEVWYKPQRQTFLVKVNHELAGFAIIDHKVPSHYVPDVLDSVCMVEFFILAAFQAQGIAEQVAVRLFDMFPGSWEVFELEKNIRAQRFWRRVISTYITVAATAKPPLLMVRASFSSS